MTLSIEKTVPKINQNVSGVQQGFFESVIGKKVSVLLSCDQTLEGVIQRVDQFSFIITDEYGQTHLVYKAHVAHLTATSKDSKGLLEKVDEHMVSKTQKRKPQNPPPPVLNKTRKKIFIKKDVQQ